MQKPPNCTSFPRVVRVQQAPHLGFLWTAAAPGLRRDQANRDRRSGPGFWA